MSLQGLSGVMFGIASGIMYALIIIFYKKVLEKNTVYTVNTYRFLISSAILMPIFFIESPTITYLNMLSLAAFGIIFGIVAVSLHTEGIRRLRANEAGIIGYVEPLAAVTYAIILLSEVPTLHTVTGGLMILGSAYILIRAK